MAKEREKRTRWKEKRERDGKMRGSKDGRPEEEEEEEKEEEEEEEDEEEVNG